MEIPEVLVFLQKGLDKDLALGTLRVQVSALTCFWGLVRGYSLVSHADVAWFLKGAKVLACWSVQ